MKKKMVLSPRRALFRSIGVSLKIFLDFWDPPTNKKKKRENFTFGVLGIKIGYKGCVEFIVKKFLENI